MNCDSWKILHDHVFCQYRKVDVWYTNEMKCFHDAKPKIREDGQLTIGEISELPKCNSNICPFFQVGLEAKK